MEQGPSWNANMRPEILEILPFLWSNNVPYSAHKSRQVDTTLSQMNAYLPWTDLTRNSSVYLTTAIEFIEVV
jgi:hypothetical protein